MKCKRGGASGNADRHGEADGRWGTDRQWAKNSKGKKHTSGRVGRQDRQDKQDKHDRVREQWVVRRDRGRKIGRGGGTVRAIGWWIVPCRRSPR